MTRAQRAARLGMIRAAAESAVNDEGMKQGREMAKYKQLLKWVDKEIRAMRLPAGYNQTPEVRRAAAEIGERTGWERKGKSVGTFLSFLLAVAEEADFHPRITEILNELVEYYEAGGQFPAPCYWAGGLAADRLEGRV
ncbi:MAG: hypothetical protein K9K82_11725 [Desulfobacteraceae bacterium]|nr:hypothetical protein [Desulfobacteraceae bacterium]